MMFGKPQYNNVYSYNAESYNPNMESQYLRAQYYNVSNGNFLTEDSYLGNITDPLTLNRYNYVKSSPLNYIDSSGHAAWDYDYVTGNYDFDPIENQLPNFENVLRNYTPTQYVQNVDSFIKGMLNWVQGGGKELTCELGTELAADLIDVLLGFGYSFIDNLLLQPHEWWQTHIQGYMPETAERWRANVEAFVIDNGVNNESAFYIGQIIGDAYQTALAFKNLPLLFKNLLSAVEALGTAFSAAIQGLHTGGGILAGAGGGTYEVTSEAVISIGQALGIAREEVLELIGAIGVAGAGLLYTVGKVTGASDDIRKLGESLSKGESETKEVNIPKNVERQAKKLSPEAKRGYEKAIDALKSGDTRGLNDHPLSGNRSGQRAIDIKGTGKGRGAGRIIYEYGEINIIEILTDHNY